MASHDFRHSITGGPGHALAMAAAGMPAGQRWHLGKVAVMLAACWPALSYAADGSAEGKAILDRHCARCHSIEPSGESPLKAAAPMRDLYNRYPTRELKEELAEGMVSRHRQMPQISFSDEEIAAILSYLYDLARSR